MEPRQQKPRRSSIRLTPALPERTHVIQEVRNLAPTEIHVVHRVERSSPFAGRQDGFLSAWDVSCLMPGLPLC